MANTAHRLGDVLVGEPLDHALKHRSTLKEGGKGDGVAPTNRCTYSIDVTFLSFHIVVAVRIRLATEPDNTP
jgi:hypothetical protein